MDALVFTQKLTKLKQHDSFSPPVWLEKNTVLPVQIPEMYKHISLAPNIHKRNRRS